MVAVKGAFKVEDAFLGVEADDIVELAAPVYTHHLAARNGQQGGQDHGVKTVEGVRTTVFQVHDVAVNMEWPAPLLHIVEYHSVWGLSWVNNLFLCATKAWKAPMMSSRAIEAFSLSTLLMMVL